MRGRYNNTENDLVTRIAVMERRLKDLEKGAGIGSTSIDSGSLTVTDGSISVGSPQSIYFGQVLLNGLYFSTGWVFRRADVSVAMTLDGVDANSQYLKIQDRAQNIVFADDGPGGIGLARPHLNITFVDHSNIVPTNTTTSGALTSLSTARFQKQHPRIRADVLVRSSDGSTTGEVQLRDPTAGVLLGSPTAITAAFYGVITLGPFTFSGAHMDTVELEIQARRTAGAGTIGIRVMNAYGEGTSA